MVRWAMRGVIGLQQVRRCGGGYVVRYATAVWGAVMVSGSGGPVQPCFESLRTSAATGIPYLRWERGERSAAAGTDKTALDTSSQRRPKALTALGEGRNRRP